MTTPEYKAGLPSNFSGKNEDAIRWMMAMKCYFAMNDHIYTDKKVAAMVFLNKMNKGRGAIFTEGWYNKLASVTFSFPLLLDILRRLPLDSLLFVLLLTP